MYFDKNPNLEPLDAHSMATRRNLMASSVLGLILTIDANLIDYAGSSFLGVKFVGLTPAHVLWPALFVIAYYMLYFGWIFYDQTRWQVLKLTGLPIPKPKTGVSAGGHGFDPGVSEERQATLTSWWVNRAKLHAHTRKMIVEASDDKSSPIRTNTISTIQQNNEHIEFEIQIIGEALYRYQNGFNSYSIRQRFRWFIFDGGIPLALGATAVIRIASQL